jgi:hypothetical protein
MRKLFIFSGLIFMLSCNDNTPDRVVETTDTTFIAMDSGAYTIEEPITFKNLIWVPVYDSTKGDYSLKQQRKVSADTLSAEKLITEINASWDGIKMEFKKISHDTIFVAIPKSEVLTQQMGSSGANSYLFSSTFILTELPKMKFVNYNFREGDHLAPGTFKRADFKK